MDKENFIFKPNLDPLANISINDVLHGHKDETLVRAMKLVERGAEERAKMIEEFEKYKERNKKA